MEISRESSLVSLDAFWNMDSLTFLDSVHLSLRETTEAPCAQGESPKGLAQKERDEKECALSQKKVPEATPRVS